MQPIAVEDVSAPAATSLEWSFYPECSFVLSELSLARHSMPENGWLSGSM